MVKIKETKSGKPYVSMPTSEYIEMLEHEIDLCDLELPNMLIALN